MEHKHKINYKQMSIKDGIITCNIRILNLLRVEIKALVIILSLTSAKQYLELVVIQKLNFISKIKAWKGVTLYRKSCIVSFFILIFGGLSFGFLFFFLIFVFETKIHHVSMGGLEFCL